MYDDKELKEYRDLLPPPDNFEEGFDWKTIIGAVFIGFLMMPGSMYLQLVIGQVIADRPIRRIEKERVEINPGCS